DRREPVDVGVEVRSHIRNGIEPLDELTHAVLHEVAHADPQRVVLHLERRVELEGLILQVEVQARERPGVAVEEPRRLAANDAVERGDALLAVERSEERTSELQLRVELVCRILLEKKKSWWLSAHSSPVWPGS